MNDKKLSFDEQIEWLKNHNVKIQNESECGEYLKYKTYFYKIIGFIKSFNCDENIEITTFEQLVDIASIDMELRYFLLRVCLDVEHWIRAYILRIITNNPEEDGYHIVQKVLSRDENPVEFKQKLFSSVSYIDENGEFQVQPEYKEVFDNPPIWTVMEVCSFGKLRSFVEYLSEERPNNHDLAQIKYCFKYINKLRNYCAHNRKIITGRIYYTHNLRVPHVLFSTLRSDRFDKEDIKTEALLQIMLVIRMHKKLCSSISNSYRKDEFENLLKRIDREKEWYDDTVFEGFFTGLKKIYMIYWNR
ncbi:Abi family protein [Lactobacillus sp. LL6]|uniref:Abi family protein n=1 Tax=Lactobacillus sp. LL6 TaxID=2596827 RepID=UPI00118703D6|nr:Abi family protein [Lactobacillus sp. LL6]TSO25699.1 Abi family protein [Lactobacillus sp. LL6]